METLRQPTTNFSPPLRLNASPETPTKVYAFDLGIARQYAVEHGSAYLKDFLRDVRYYTGETYGKLSADVYNHEIHDSHSGHSEIGFWRGTEWVPARNSYAKVANDLTKPEWYRHRAQRDWQWVLNIESKLNQTPGQENIPWVDLSPTAYKVSLEERRDANFNLHSFARVHWRSGNKLVSVAHRNYLSESSQPEFFKLLTGKEATVEEMLGRVEDLKEGLTVTDVPALAQNIYNATPEQFKVHIPEEEQDMKDVQDIENILTSTQPLLLDLYRQMMDQYVPNTRVLKSFKRWEMLVKAMAKGEAIDLEAIQHIGRSAPDRKKALIALRRFEDMAYEPGKNDCGNGVGMGNLTGGGKVRLPGTVLALSGSSLTEQSKNDPNYWHEGECINPECAHPKGEKLVVGPCKICRDCDSEITFKEKLTIFSGSKPGARS